MARRNVELKPPQEVVDAIRASEDGSTAPPPSAGEAMGGYSGNTPRVIRAAIENEEPQRPSEMAAASAQQQQREGGGEGEGEAGAASGAVERGVGAAAAERSQRDAEQTTASLRAQQQQQRYSDRDRLPAGKQGRGPEAVHGKASIMQHNRGQTDKGGSDQRRG